MILTILKVIFVILLCAPLAYAAFTFWGKELDEVAEKTGKKRKKKRKRRSQKHRN